MEKESYDARALKLLLKSRPPDVVEQAWGEYLLFEEHRDEISDLFSQLSPEHWKNGSWWTTGWAGYIDGKRVISDTLHELVEAMHTIAPDKQGYCEEVPRGIRAKQVQRRQAPCVGQDSQQG